MFISIRCKESDIGVTFPFQVCIVWLSSPLHQLFILIKADTFHAVSILINASHSVSILISSIFSPFIYIRIGLSIALTYTFAD
jgi:hypothetical protein